MAVARIITRSQTCSQELSLVLLARGYTVEIVSPDKVPDNIADLELRVEAGPANELIANVEAHNGGHTTSLEFVHHLKAPVLAFPRSPSDRGEVVHTSGEPVGFITRPSNESGALPANAWQPSLGVIPHLSETSPHHGTNSEIQPVQSARPIVSQVLTPLEAPSGDFAVDDAGVLQPTLTVQTIPRQTGIPQIMCRNTMDAPIQAMHRPGEWPWRAGLAFAILVTLATVLGVGERSSKVAARGSEVSPLGRIAASDSGKHSNAVDVEKDLVVNLEPWGLLAADPEATPTRVPKQVRDNNSRTPTTKPKTAVSRKRDDLIARDTTVYFDKRFEPHPKAKQAKPIAH